MVNIDISIVKCHHSENLFIILKASILLTYSKTVLLSYIARGTSTREVTLYDLTRQKNI